MDDRGMWWYVGETLVTHHLDHREDPFNAGYAGVMETLERNVQVDGGRGGC